MLHSLLVKLTPKKVFLGLFFSFVAAIICGIALSNTYLIVTSFICLFIVILLFADRRKAVNDQTTSGDTFVTGTALMVMLPLFISFFAAYAILCLILSSGFEKTPSGLTFFIFATAAIFYGIRVTSRLFERKSWKVPLD